MLLIALVSPLLLGPGSVTAPVDWAASVGIARVEAKRSGRPVVAVYTPSGRGYWMMNMLAHPRVRNLASRFVAVNVDIPTEFDNLVPGVDAPPFAQLVFTSSDGRIVKRLSGLLRPVDLEQCFRQVEHALNRAADPKTPDDQAWWATRQAMGGNVAAATQLLAGPARNASSAARAEAFGALGDELRAEGQSEKAMAPLQTAVALSQTPSQTARWTVRLALNRARMGERVRAIRQLRTGAELPGLSEEERSDIQDLANRLSDGPSIMRVR
ncbi:MAG: hypothetical protein ACO1SV_27400 [Fimbriimonas sp.]